MFILQNVQFFFPLLRLSIMGSYGHVRLSSEEYAEKGERLDSDSIRDSRPQIARPLQSVFLSAACSNAQNMGRRDQCSPSINEVADWDNCGIY